jgi:hypothetical protein
MSTDRTNRAAVARAAFLRAMRDGIDLCDCHLCAETSMYLALVDERAALLERIARDDCSRLHLQDARTIARDLNTRLSLLERNGPSWSMH